MTLIFVIIIACRRGEKQKQQRSRVKVKAQGQRKVALKCYGGLFSLHSGFILLLVDMMSVPIHLLENWLKKLSLIPTTIDSPPGLEICDYQS